MHHFYLQVVQGSEAPIDQGSEDGDAEEEEEEEQQEVHIIHQQKQQQFAVSQKNAQFISDATQEVPQLLARSSSKTQKQQPELEDIINEVFSTPKTRKEVVSDNGGKNESKGLY